MLPTRFVILWVCESHSEAAMENKAVQKMKNTIFSFNVIDLFDVLSGHYMSINFHEPAQGLS